MVKVWKEIIRPGRYYYIDEETGQPRQLVVTQAGVRHLFNSGKEMRAAGLSIPLPVEHQKDAMPMTASERAAKRLLNNAGEVEDFKVEPGDRLFGLCNIEDPEVARKIPRTIRWTSPWITSFVDGDGRSWQGVIGHLALTSRPRITRQQPFPSVAAALTQSAGTYPATDFGAQLMKAGLLLSRAGLVEGEGSGMKPVYPIAFSLWSGALFSGDSNTPSMTKKPAGKDAKMADPLEKGKGPDGAPGGVSDAHDPGLPGGAETEVPGNPAEEALVDSDGDIDIEAVLCDLLDAAGIQIDEGTNKESFMQNAYKALMQFVKNKGMGGAQMDNANQPPTGTKNDLPPNPYARNTSMNPILQEQPPMYMSLSLEDAQKITDPATKAIALSMVQMRQRTETLEKAAIGQARIRRDARVKEIGKWLPEAARKRLEEDCVSAQFSFGTDGQVIDPIAGMLDILEAGMSETRRKMQQIPALLTTPSAMFAEQPHPAEQNYSAREPGELSPERRDAVVNEFVKNTKLDFQPFVPQSADK